jgi:hypothetical protein
MRNNRQMPEPPNMVPLYVARVADLRIGNTVGAICRNCGHLADVPVVIIRQRVSPHEFVKHIGPRFRCRECGQKAAEIDARHALGHYG